MRKEKRDKGLIKTVLDKASYSVGFICAKTAKIRDITKAESWKNTVSASKDLMEKASEKTSAFIHDAREGAAHIKESFVGGFESAKEGVGGHDGAKKPAKSNISARSKVKSGAVAIKEAKTSSGTKAKAKSREKLSPQEKRKKIKELSETPADPDIEKEIKKIDEEVADVN